jgi:urease accessory protein UreF
LNSCAAQLILADGRLPSGGYAHSAGLEQAIRQGWVTDIDGLRDFLRGRLHTTGLMNAAFAVAAWKTVERMDGNTVTEAAPRFRRHRRVIVGELRRAIVGDLRRGGDLR